MRATAARLNDGRDRLEHPDRDGVVDGPERLEAPVPCVRRPASRSLHEVEQVGIDRVVAHPPGDALAESVERGEVGLAVTGRRPHRLQSGDLGDERTQ